MAAFGSMPALKPGSSCLKAPCRLRRRIAPCICRSDPLRTDRRALGTATLLSAVSLMSGVPAAADDELSWAQVDDRHDSATWLSPFLTGNTALAPGMHRLVNFAGIHDS